MINGNEFAWEDIAIAIRNSRPVKGITEIKYKRTREHENIHGIGSDPVAIGRGKANNEGSLKILQSELQALQAAAPGGDITRLVFDVTVSYAAEVGTPVTDILLYCRINEFEKGMAQGDSHMEVDLPLTVGDIKYNI